MNMGAFTDGEVWMNDEYAFIKVTKLYDKVDVWILAPSKLKKQEKYIKQAALELQDFYGE